MIDHKPRVYEWSKTLTSTPKKARPKKASVKKSKAKMSEQLAQEVNAILETQSAEDIVLLDIRDKSSIADFMIVATGRSNRHVSALTDYVKRGLKETGHEKLGIEGLEQCDWVLIDAGDVIVHLFRPEVRDYYALEKLWSVTSLTEDV